MNDLESHIIQFVRYLSRQDDVAKNTATAYDSDLHRFMAYLGTHTPDIRSWDKVRATTLQQYVDFMREEQGLKASTVTRRIFAVRSFFGFLEERGTVSEDPCSGLSLPNLPRRSPRTLSPQEIERLLRQPAKDRSRKGLRDRALLEILYATGLRVSQLIALSLGDVDLASGTIRLIEEGQERVLLMNERAIEALRAYLEQGRMQYARDSQVMALFVNRYGRPLSRQGIWLIIKQYVEQANITTKVTPRILRHAFARRQLAEGATPNELRQMLGYASYSSTWLYLHTQDQEDRRTSDESEGCSA